MFPFTPNFFFSGTIQSPDGNVVVRSDARVSSLTLKYVKYTDAGQYLCTARSAIGEDEQIAYLEVRCKYFLVFQQSDKYLQWGKLCLGVLTVTMSINVVDYLGVYLFF